MLIDLHFADLVEVWGAERVVTFSSDDLGSAVPDPTTAGFLAEVGLPRELDGIFTCVPGLVHGNHLRLGIGWSHEFEYYVDSATGTVMIHFGFEGDGHKDMYVNGDVAAFAYFLNQFRGMGNIWEDDPNNDIRIESEALHMQSRLAAVDREAVDERNWWWENIQAMSYV